VFGMRGGAQSGGRCRVLSSIGRDNHCMPMSKQQSLRWDARGGRSATDIFVGSRFPRIASLMEIHPQPVNLGAINGMARRRDSAWQIDEPVGWRVDHRIDMVRKSSGELALARSTKN